jgi:DNA mismatch repair protein MutS2
MIRTESLEALQFTIILHTIGRHAYSDATRDEILSIRPFAGRGEIGQRFGQVDEIRLLRRTGVALPLSPFHDISPILEAVRPEGAILDPRDLVMLGPALRVMGAIGRQFAYRTDIPLLRDLAGHVAGFPDILDPLDASLDEQGNILDSASKLLFDLRTRKRSLTARIRKRLEEIVREKHTAIFLQDDFITQRAGRWVIPVRMDSKGMVAGVVHDVSNSGETAFMEPLEIIGLANELENLSAEEKAEQIRILRQLCTWIREDADGIDSQFRAVVQLDLLNSVSCFAEQLEAETPGINTVSEMHLRQARHPILLLLNKERGGRDVVPLDLSLGEGGRGMVITGPNAGGKTIALKTAGLLLVMALSGIPVPAASTSSFPLVDELLVDIGDEQSIEESLSTFSAHISNIAGILRRAGDRTLVLMDELGTGTEPGQGAAIACAVLHDLLGKGALVLATTHLTDIIGFVHKTSGLVNASMEFDRRTLTPLYRLKAGEPGQSHAIEIAQRYGLPESVIAFAQGMVGRLESDFHELLAELKEKGREHEEAIADLHRRSEVLAEQELLLAARAEASGEREREILEKGRMEAREIIQAAKREVNAILEEARKEKSRAAKERIERAEREAEAKLRELRQEKELSLGDVAEGDVLFVRPIGHDATVIAVDRRQGRLRVRAGLMDLDVLLSDVAHRTGKAPPRKETRRRKEDEEHLSLELNIIGLRVDEALPELERFLNRVSVAGWGEARIVHGKGTGALMRAVRDHLGGHPLVAEFRKGEPFEGGDGATVVTLR